MELHDDLNNIKNSYLNEPDTCFWVAEVYDNIEAGPLAAELNILDKVILLF